MQSAFNVGRDSRMTQFFTMRDSQTVSHGSQVKRYFYEGVKTITFKSKEKMRIPVRLLLSAALAGVMVPVFLLYSGTWYTQSRRESSSTSEYPEVNGFHTTAEEHSSTINQKLQSRFRAESWRNHIERSCKKFGYFRELDSFDTNIIKNSKILVDDRHKIMYCQIPKVASTTWRRILLMLSGKVDTEDLMSLSANDVHHKYDKHLMYLKDLQQHEIIYRLKHYFKFVFVREPFERILSAFRNKFVAMTNSSVYFKRVFGTKIITNYRSETQQGNVSQDLSFEEFVAYLIDPDKKIPMNEHWERFYKLCHPCWINYDFIGKLENLETDSEYILESNSLSGKVKVPSRADSKYSKLKTKAYLYEYYSRIPRNSLQKLYEMYYADFVIFNFTIPDAITSLMYG